MGDFLGTLIEWLWHLRQAETWVTRTGGWTLACLVAVAAGMVLYERNFAWYLQAGVPVAVLAVVYGAWYATRELYWYWGRGRKIGICYEGYKVSSDDWVLTRRELEKLVRTSPFQERVRLKHIPPSHIETEGLWARTEAKYGFASVFRVTASAPVKSGGNPVIRLQMPRQLHASLSEDFRRITIADMAQLLGAKTETLSLAEMLRLRAGSLFDVLLLHLGVIDFAERKYPQASVYLSLLDERLSPKCSKDQEPRRHIRWLNHLCLCLPSAFEPDCTPVGEDLVAVTEMAREAVTQYGEQFPEAYAALARDLFYMKKLEESLQATESALTRNLPPALRATNLLNRAVLNLFLANWSRAEQAFKELLASAAGQQMTWKSLIAFADHAAQYGEPHAIYLQCLYRRLAAIEVMHDMEEELIKWLDGDESRYGLRYIYNDIARRHAKALQTPEAPKRKRRSKKARRLGR